MNRVSLPATLSIGEAAADAELAQVLERYLADLEAGKAVDPQQLYAEHPHLADRLRDCLGCLQFVEHAAGEIGMATPERFEGPTGVLGDYRIVREIGRGGMGVVYEAEQISLSRRVALKVLPFAAMLDARALQRFKNEALAAAHLEHPHIVHVYGVGSERGLHYFAMQFVDGRNLAEVVRELRRAECGVRNGEEMRSSEFGVRNDRSPHPGSLPEGEGDRETNPRAALSTVRSAPWTSVAHFHHVARLGIQAAEALAHAHACGVVHRDVKPSNLMIDAAGHLWVTDFGVARIQNQPGLTFTRDVVGTLRYMSPEQAQGNAALVDPRSDVYSLGATLYELITLEPPFASQDHQRLLHEISFEEPRPPRRLNSSVPVDLETIVLKALSREAAHRYGTAQEMADDLRRFLADQPVRARRPSLAQRAARWSRSNRPLVRAVTATAACVTLMAAVWIVRERNEAVHQRDIAQERAVTIEEQNQSQRTQSLFRLWEDHHLPAARELLDDWQRRGIKEPEHDFAWDYLRRIVGGERITRGHQHPVYDVAFSPDGERLASAGADMTIGIWNAASGALETRLRHDRVWVASVCFSPDGLWLVSGGGIHGRSEVKLWDVASRNLVMEIAGPEFTVDVVVFSPDGRTLAIGGIGANQRGEIMLWDAATAQSQSLAASSAVLSLAFSPDSRLLAAGLQGQDTTPGRLELWDVESRNRIANLVGHLQPVRSVAFSPDGGTLASGSADRTLRLWDLETHTTWATFEAGANQVTGLAFSPDGQSLAVGGSQIHLSPGERYPVELWNPRTGTRQATLGSTGSGIHSLAYSPDGAQLAIGCLDGSIYWWKIDERIEAEYLLTDHREAWGVAFAPTGTILASGGDDNAMRLWDFNRLQELTVGRSHDSTVMSLAMHPRKDQLATADYHGHVNLWNFVPAPAAATAAPVASGRPAPLSLAWAWPLGGDNDDQLNDLALDSEGNLLITGYFHGQVDFDPTNGVALASSQGQHDVFVAKYSGSGELLWMRSVGGPQKDFGWSLAVDASGSVYVAGAFSQTVDFDPGPERVELVSSSETNLFVWKLDRDGQTVWVRDVGPNMAEQWINLAVGSSGQATIVHALGEVTVARPDPIDPLNSGLFKSSGMRLARLDAEGSLLWERTWTGLFDRPKQIAVDAKENVYVAASCEGAFDFQPGDASVERGGMDLLLLKLSAAGEPAGAHRWGGRGHDRCTALVIDPQQRVSLAGSFTEEMELGEGAQQRAFTSRGNSDIFVASCNAEGTLDWAVSFGGTSYDSAATLALDAQARFCLTGAFRDTADFSPGPARHELTSAGLGDVFLLRLESTGEFVDVQRFGGPAEDYVQRVAAGGAGRMYLAGGFQKQIDVDPSHESCLLACAGAYDGFVAALTPSEGRPGPLKPQLALSAAWRLGGESSDSLGKMIVDRDGNLLLAGYVYGSFDFDHTSFKPQPRGYCDAFVAKYRPSGVLVWMRTVGGPEEDFGASLAVDHEGAVYVVGGFARTVDFNPGGKPLELTSAEGHSLFAWKLDKEGSTVWAQNLGTAKADRGIDVAAGESGGVTIVHAVGNFVFVGADPADANDGVSRSSAMRLARLNSDGSVLWEQQWKGAFDSSRCLTLDAEENVYLAAGCEGPFELRPGDLLPAAESGGLDILLLKVAADGKPTWARRSTGQGVKSAFAIQRGPDRSLYLSGTFAGELEFAGLRHAERLTVAGASDAFVVKLSETGELVWARSAGGPDYDSGGPLAVDRQGHAYLSGRFRQTADFQPGPGKFELSSNALPELFVWRLDSSGKSVNAQSVGGLARESVTGLAFDASGRPCLAGRFEQSIDLDPSRETHMLTSSGPTDVFVAVFWPQAAALADRPAMAPKSESNEVRAALATQYSLSLAKTLNSHPAPVRSMAYSPDGKWLAAANDQKAVWIWNAAEGTVFRRLDEFSSSVLCLAWKPDSTCLASLESDGTLSVWEVSSGKRRWTHRGIGGGRCRFSPDGQTIAAGNRNGALVLLTAATGETLRVMQPHGAELRALAFHPGGQSIATAGKDSAIRLWNVKTGLELLSFAEPVQVNDLAFSADGRTLAAALHDGTVKLWKSRP